MVQLWPNSVRTHRDSTSTRTIGRTGGRALRRVVAVLALVFAAAATQIAPPAHAAPPTFAQFASRDVLVGTFFSSDADLTDTMYYSTDGKKFTYLSTPYRRGQNPMSDPSIIYHNGYFWMLSNWPRKDGRFWPMIGVSRDGKNWSRPEGRQFNNGLYAGIPLNPAPGGRDIVAPDWYRAADGSIYIVFTAGYFGHFRGQVGADRMTPYVVRVNQLDVNAAGRGRGVPLGKNIVFNAGPATRIALNPGAKDRIDGSFFERGGTKYLTIKRDGTCNEVWRSGSFTGPWHRDVACAANVQEGPSMTRLGGTYYLYTDKIYGGRAIYYSTAPSPSGPWSNPTPITTAGGPGRTRHGTVIRLDDRNAKCAVYRMAYGPGCTLTTGVPGIGGLFGS
ncbi:MULTISPECIES: hypothetical protein [unclassified Gordonia (in: high G+C Gram-positive bacteria)]